MDSDGIQRVLDAPDEFEILKLPHPHKDLLGRPSWPVSDDELSRAFRKVVGFEIDLMNAGCSSCPS
jgi:predicted secreted protein